MQKSTQLLLIVLSCGMTCLAFGETTNDFCGGPSELLSVIDRPTAADSPCAVPNNNTLLELGTKYQKLLYRNPAQDFPEANFRIGLPKDNEFYILLPNYTHQPNPQPSGFSSVLMGIKHVIQSTNDWIATIEGVLLPPSGSPEFGNSGLGSTLNGIFSYNINNQLGLTGMFGISTQTQPINYGGKRFTSFNPDVILTWKLKDDLQLFGEIYGQTLTGPHQGCGYNIDAGLLYLIAKNVSFDIEAGQNLTGVLGGFKQYFGAGFAILF